MHVVVVKQSADISLNSLHPQLITQGHVLHGAVKMIKYDIIPKHFHHRYLLSDWDLVSLTSDERKHFRQINTDGNNNNNNNGV